ncbi:stage II sporulation protein M [Streptomyces sp. NPDC052496]|uniref:stage II sporulation protein M n=1 Tax=Streptomyces sp. NPDC052496 TaxID=3154951 RepID=UPI0034434EAA
MASIARRQRLTLALGQVLWFGCLLCGVLIADEKSQSVHVAPKQPSLDLFTGILANNCGIAAVAFSGVVTFGLGAVLLALFAGLSSGLFISQAYALGAMPFARTVLPHAVLELPAFGVAVAAGLAPALAVVRALLAGRKVKVSESLVDAAALLGLSMAMLVVAACVETWVSTR